MSEKVPKNKYIIEEEFDEEDVDEIKVEDILEKKILKILSNNSVDSKLTLINLLLKAGIKDYELRMNLLSNEINAEIPKIGKTLKKLRFEKKVNFSIQNGAHSYFLDKKKKMLSLKKTELKFDWKSYEIPDGNDEIYLIFKIPGSSKRTHHFLMSCFPSAEISGFKLFVNKKFEQTNSFAILKDKLDGYFEEDKLILRCKTSNSDIDRTLYKLLQIGRSILKELVQLNFRYSELLKIFFPLKTDFFTAIPVFRSNKQGIFYENKFRNSLRIIYDFPNKFEGKLIYGKYSLIINGDKGQVLELKDYYKFISEAFEYQIKSFISLSIVNDWVINPTKALNYMEEDDDLRNLIEEYKQDIDTDRIIQERLEETLEKGEFFKEITSNLILTLLSVSLLADFLPLQLTVVVILIVVNFYYFYKRRKKFRKRTQIA